MKISTKGRYALRMMLDIALHPDEYTKIKDVTARQQISEKYLEQIVTILNRAGYVKSVRGAQGGYYLAKRPEEYTIGMILRLTEGSLCPVDCVENGVGSCGRSGLCVTIHVWQRLNDAICDVVDHITLADLVEDYHRLQDQEGGNQP